MLARVTQTVPQGTHSVRQPNRQPPPPQQQPAEQKEEAVGHILTDKSSEKLDMQPNATEDEVTGSPASPYLKQELFKIRSALLEEKAKRAQAEEAAVRARAEVESGGSAATVRALKISHAAEVKRLQQELAAVGHGAGNHEIEAQLQVSKAALQAETAVRTAAQSELAEVKEGLAALEAEFGVEPEVGAPMRHRLRALQGRGTDAGANEMGLRKEVAELRAELEEAKVAQAKSEDDKAALLREKGTMEAVVDKLSGVCDKLSAEKLEVEEECTALTSECEQFSALLEEANAEIKRHDGHEVAARLQAAQDEIKTMRSQEKQLQALLTESEARSKDSNEELIAERNRIQARLDDVLEEVRLEKLEERGQQKLVDLTDRAECAEKKADMLQIAAETAKRQVVELQEEVKQLRILQSQALLVQQQQPVPPAFPPGSPKPAVPGVDVPASPATPIVNDALQNQHAAHARIMAALNSPAPGAAPGSPVVRPVVVPAGPTPLESQVLIQDLQDKNRNLELELMRIQDQNHHLEKAMASSESRIEILAAKSETRRMEKELEEARKERQGARDELRQFRAGRLEAQSELKAMKSELEAKERTVKELESAHAELTEKDIPSYERRLREAMAQCADIKGQNEDLEELSMAKDKTAKEREELVASLEAQLSAVHDEMQRKDDALFAKEEMIRSFLYEKGGQVSLHPDDAEGNPARKSLEDRVREHRQASGVASSIGHEGLSTDERKAALGMTTGESQPDATPGVAPAGAPMSGAMASMVARASALEAENGELRLSLVNALALDGKLKESHRENEKLQRIIAQLQFECRKHQMTASIAVAPVTASPSKIVPPTPVVLPDGTTLPPPPVAPSVVVPPLITPNTPRGGGTRWLLPTGSR